MVWPSYGTLALCSWRTSSLPDGQSRQNTELIGSNRPCFITNVYGPATQKDKLTFIHNLDCLSTLTNDHRWIMGRDFNMICNLEEKRGGIRRLEVESDTFNP
jgi:hypothetical protein